MTSSTLVVLPIMLPVAAGLLAALARKHPATQRALVIAGAASMTLAAFALILRVQQLGTVRVALGGWAAPFGIELVADPLAALLVLCAALTGLVCIAVQLGDAVKAPCHPLLLPLVFGVLAGVAGAFLTGDLFNLYVWIELSFIAVLGLFVLGGQPDHADATYKYLVLNLLGTILLLMAVAFIYGATGQLNYAAAGRAAWTIAPGVALLVQGTLLLALVVKTGAAPFSAWLPASYHTLPVPVLALSAALLTKVALYAILRLAGGAFAPAPPVLLQALGWIGAVTMLLGAFGTVYHTDLRRIVGYFVISAVGFVLIGVAVATPGALAAASFYIVHDIVIKVALVVASALVAHACGTWDLRRMGGLWEARPVLATLFLIVGLSLVGIPPLSGFWAKYYLLREIIAGAPAAWTVIALLASLVTLYAFARIWIEAFWKEPPPGEQASAAGPLSPAAVSAAAAVAAITLAIGLWPEPLARYVLQAANALTGTGTS